MPTTTPTARRVDLLGVAARHLVTRFSYGVTPALADDVRAHGSARAWFDRQLTPGSVPDRATTDIEGWFPHLAWSPQRLWHEQVSGGVPGWKVMSDYANWLLLRRMTSHRQVLEVLTEFWENRLNVPVDGDGAFTWRKPYGDLVRSHALGTFESLLYAATTHPAMGIYLDNAFSDKQHPNENLGRELLELHTVGVGNYTEDDVKSSARILTGWRVDEWKTWAAAYDPGSHWTGPVKVGTFRSPNVAADGRAVTREYLRYLAHHPDTAQRIARKLAIAFVRDDPPAALVDHLARVYLANGTAIPPVLKALVESPAFGASVGVKVRDTEGDVVATYRALGVRVAKPTGPESAAHTLVWQCGSLGAQPQSWPQPNGQPIDNVSWSSPSRMLGSMNLHYGMSGGWWPTKDVHYRSPVDWLPSAEIRFDHLVDHLSRTLLHRPVTPLLLRACSQAVAVRTTETITKDHALVRWLFPRLLTTLLDSPAHYRR